MEPPLDLYRASREELITLVLRQRAQMAELEQEVATQRRDAPPDGAGGCPAGGTGGAGGR
jgi:hypothetical protein